MQGTVFSPFWQKVSAGQAAQVVALLMVQSGHSGQEAAPPLLAVKGGQKLHCAALTAARALPKRPAGQGAGAALPGAHTKPGLHVPPQELLVDPSPPHVPPGHVFCVALEDPAAHQEPGEQGPEHPALAIASVAPNLPAGQSSCALEAGGQKAPALHWPLQAAFCRPCASPSVPPGQASGVTVPEGQK